MTGGGRIDKVLIILPRGPAVLVTGGGITQMYPPPSPRENTQWKFVPNAPPRGRGHKNVNELVKHNQKCTALFTNPMLAGGGYAREFSGCPPPSPQALPYSECPAPLQHPGGPHLCSQHSPCLSRTGLLSCFFLFFFQCLEGGPGW
jgi:hypothetical protein